MDWLNTLWWSIIIIFFLQFNQSTFISQNGSLSCMLVRAWVLKMKRIRVSYGLSKWFSPANPIPNPLSSLVYFLKNVIFQLYERAWKVGWKLSGRSGHFSSQAECLFLWGNVHSVLRTANRLDQVLPDSKGQCIALSLMPNDCRCLWHLQHESSSQKHLELIE